MADGSGSPLCGAYLVSYWFASLKEARRFLHEEIGAFWAIDGRWVIAGLSISVHRYEDDGSVIVWISPQDHESIQERERKR
ncbi:hypothetical protein [Sandaracinus amylolyticus]|uniref:hypothetical protein n=1 Tax=Sandaracinus amylolyticus TaxID=927083 RepID=UPI00069CC6E1|nr:hypothetical protein [Sandaracinus amylolyticus]